MKLHHDDYPYGWSTGFTYAYWLALFVAVIFVMMITGCSTMQLSPEATAAQKKAALCCDAQMGFALATTVMNTTNMTPEQATYWARYLAGAQEILKVSCM